jgi:chorismate mutase
MDIEDWRGKIDELDRQMVSLLNARAEAAKAIGKLKHATALPIYEPNRERVIFEHVHAANKGPLRDIELTHIYERIIDVMRSVQREDPASAEPAQGGEGEKGRMDS